MFLTLHRTDGVTNNSNNGSDDGDEDDTDIGNNYNQK